MLTVATTRQPKLIFENAHETLRIDAQDDKVNSPQKIADPCKKVSRTLVIGKDTIILIICL